MKSKIVKYRTGSEIPEGAIYLSTQVEKHTEVYSYRERPDVYKEQIASAVHYFLVKIEDENNN